MDLLKGLRHPWLIWVTYEFKYLETEKITPVDFFMNAYAEEVYKSEHFRTSTKQLRVILDAKYEKADLNKGMENQCQHMTEIQYNELLKLFAKL